ncbi:hypothetical protein NG895_25340 [Aeoliella sp. ICT_H6.2]|uniref:Uncharacterized protein n=1 Tax=Aeoliella straminimaris TaxID=2954799 RepID=A0A9X2FFE4_9BACT|nr:hypothetical protein [Aeoliella straminimaris]MCO6047238.1 hypothetical protein [Aeoliella straminimaris]
MAARQDQTLQIALIVFAILLVGFMAFTYYFYKQASDASQQLDAMTDDRDSQRSAANNMGVENEQLRQWMGFEQFAEFDTVSTQVKADMDRMAGTLAEDKRNYRDALELMYKSNLELAQAQAVDKQKNKDLETKLREVEAGHQAQIAQLQADKEKIEQAAAAQRNQFTDARAALEQSKSALAKQISDQTAAFEQERTQLTSARNEAQEEASKRQRTIDQLKEERKQEDFSFEIADGKITWVNQSNNTVWINIGSADSLRQQVTFSVFDNEDTDAGKAEKKGAVEVVRMLGEHMAECRVTDDDPRNPILPGDYIYSQVWHHGKPQHFALTGLIDLDDDGQSDLQLAKDLIELNGGVVDAYPNPETNELEGEMTAETRFMVFGERSDRTNDSALRDTWDKMHNEANAMGVELISVTDFLNQMGYKPDNRAVNLGAGVNANDFRPRPAPSRGDLRPRVNYSTP